jgi:hypothetical protein
MFEYTIDEHDHLKILRWKAEMQRRVALIDRDHTMYLIGSSLITSNQELSDCIVSDFIAGEDSLL